MNFSSIEAFASFCIPLITTSLNSSVIRGRQKVYKRGKWVDTKPLILNNNNIELMII